MNVRELGHIVLYVSSLRESSRFYQDVLGFPLVGTLPGAALFSGGRTHHELLLIEIGGPHPPKTKRRPEPGLYHIGFKIGTTPEELIKATRELQKAKVPILGATDHGATHSLYLLDPDGNELELYIDVSDEWRKNPQALLSPPRPLAYLPLDSA